jgi:hypothetical protein
MLSVSLSDINVRLRCCSEITFGKKPIKNSVPLCKRASGTIFAFLDGSQYNDGDWNENLLDT